MPRPYIALHRLIQPSHLTVILRLQKKLRYRSAPGGMLQVWRDFGQWNEHKFAKKHAGMRDLQFLRIDNLVPVKKNIQIN